MDWLFTAIVALTLVLLILLCVAMTRYIVTGGQVKDKPRIKRTYTLRIMDDGTLELIEGKVKNG